ncbi:MAG: type VII secretion protein EccE [Mycolicibacterium sp.]|uniref:type VII secretion protein EccE n=1 Tax=Mycolicibacterium sp. TaxID=2320850 RepID=UPI003D0AC58A
MRRNRPIAPPITVAAGENTGVRWHDHQLIAALDLHGHPHVVSTLSQRRIVGAGHVPLDALDEVISTLGGGAPSSVDLVFDTSRLAMSPYANAYSTLLAGRPLAGRRRSVALLRFDPAQHPTYYAPRPSLPEAVAATVARIQRALTLAGCPATPLSESELDAFDASIAASSRQRWTHMAPTATDRLTDTTYSLDPNALSDARLPELWSIRADSVVLTLRRDRYGRWLGFVRVRAPRPPTHPPLPFLRTLPSQQGVASVMGRAVLATTGPRVVFDAVATPDLSVLPCGPDGQILGMTNNGDQLVVPLTPAPGRVVAARLDALYAEQQLLRSAACGSHVTIITTRPGRWAELAGPRITTIAPGDARLGQDATNTTADVHVYDQLRAPTDPDTASVSLSEIGSNTELHGQLILDQYDDMVAVTTGGRTEWIRAVVDPSEIPHLPSARRRTPVGARR